MALSQDIIYFRLAQKFEVRFSIRAEMTLTCKRPVLFEAGKDQLSCAVLITPEELSTLDMSGLGSEGILFICLGIPMEFDISPWCSLISVLEDTSLAAILNELQEVFATFVQWEDALKAVVNNSEGFQDLVLASEGFFFDAFCIQDKDFHFIGSSLLFKSNWLVAQRAGQNNSSPLAVVNEFMSNTQYVLQQNSDDAHFYSFSFGFAVVKNMIQGKECIGRIVIEVEEIDNKLFWYYAALLDTLAYYTGMLYARFRGFDNQESHTDTLRGYLIDLLNGKGVSLHYIERALLEIGWQPGERFRLIQAKPGPRSPKGMDSYRIVSEIAQIWPGYIGFEYYDRLLVLENTNVTSPDSNKAHPAAFLGYLAENALASGISRGFGDLKAIHTAYEQTEVAFVYGTRSDPALGCYRFNDVALPYMLEQSMGAFDPQDICSEKLLALREYDRKNNAEMCKTLSTYIGCRFNASAAANRLCIHRTSFINRLERMEEIAGIDLDSSDEVLYLSLSLMSLK
ncbi:MAG: helix-turn-helix domain-containing protein [Eggerthellaceae bacterium]|nr:helix-turn-helix domain-containing protein [Eggerthellaceae bacterium]